MGKTLFEIQEERERFNVKDVEKYYFDINKIGIISTKSRNEDGFYDLALVINEEAVMESIYNILLTQPGERVMNPRFGCDLDRYLFEPLDDVTGFKLMREIYNAIQDFEPRAINLEVVVTPDLNVQTFIVDIYFSVNTSNEPVKFQTTLEKVR